MLRKATLFTLIVLAATPGASTLLAQSVSAKTSSVTDSLPADNPFAAPSSLPFYAPAFDTIKTEHYQPAFQAGMKQQLEEISAITDNTDAPTFANTIEALERSGALLGRVRRVFSNMTGSHTNSDLQNIQKELAPQLAAHSDNIHLNRQLFARIDSLQQQSDALDLTEEQREVLKQHHEDFVRAGAKLSDEQQVRVRVLNEQLSTLQTQFEDNLLEVMKERSVIVNDAGELEGLSDAEIAAASELAKDRGHDGRYLLEITNTTRVPILGSLKNRSLRERVWKASAFRAIGENGGIDNRPLILETAQLRAERAELLGYANHSAYKLSDQVARTPDAALKMLTDLVPGVVARVKEEAEMLKDAMAEHGVEHELQPWDWEYYAERVRETKFQVDETEVKPYFELNSVLENGVFFTMKKLFGVEFRERKDLPLFHPEVRIFDVLNDDGSHVGLFYFDPFKRDSKRGGAWMSTYVLQSLLLERKPVIANTLNIPRPAEGEPALISFDNVTTLFHEMGHGVHGLFSQVKYPSVAGTATPRDFVEFPSTFQEDWAIQPDILSNYARHYKTGQKIPEELLEKVIAASRFNQGFDTLEYLSAAILDMAWHMLSSDEIPNSIEEFEAATLKKFGVDIAAVPPRYKTAYFAHIWGGGYASSYYAYIWSEVLAADAFAYMIENGGATRQNGERFRREVLSRGSSRDPMKSYREYRGQNATVDALLIRRGLK